MVDFKVLKKDGSEEAFRRDKIVEACKSAGAKEGTANFVADEVIKDLKTIKSSRLRDLILKKLRKHDPDAADEWVKYDVEKKSVNEQGEPPKF